jgi:chromosome segregation ATPase
LKEKFKSLHEVVVQSFENEKILINKARELKQDLFKQRHQLETVSQQQAETALTRERLTKSLEDVSPRQTQAELDLGEQKVQLLDSELALLEQDRNEAYFLLSQREQEQQAKIQPELDRLGETIEAARKEIAETDERILKERTTAGDFETRIRTLQQEIEVHTEEVEVTTLNLNKLKAEPLQFAKNNEIRAKAIVGLEADLKRIQAESDSLDTTLHGLNAEKDKESDLIEAIRTELSRLRAQHDELTRRGDEILNKRRQEEELDKTWRNNVLDCEVKLNALIETARRESDTGQELGKILMRFKKDYKKSELSKRQIATQYADIHRELLDARNRNEALMEDKERQSRVLEKLKEEKDILSKKKLDQEDLEHAKVEDNKEMQLKIKEAEDKAQEMRDEEQKLNSKMLWLARQREQMARKASQNISMSKEIQEEIKIKKLLTIDLSKKHQETEGRLKSFVALYDEVKNARNKYVKLIQNRSQELAETKERIKILQNEVEILRNESAEKERRLKEERHNFHTCVHDRDALRADINKLEYTIKTKRSTLQQLETEKEKLNITYNTLEKEMVELKHKYELACESRNYTGIQLIDRNDELCILYEKANIQENIQKRGEAEIRGKEDELRMLNLELAEVQRKIDVERKRIPEVPKMAAEVLNLKTELEAEKDVERQLASELEDPSNKQRWRELEGDDPDQEALEAKIQVLEERLNNKKEALLEKELVLEEISNLADKLRVQALTGRQSTLELAERVNDFQSRIKGLTHKMMATVAELSMFQASAMTLQADKERLEEVLEEAYENMNAGRPPLDDCVKEFARMQRNVKMREEEHEARRQREEDEKQAPGIVTRTTAEPRPLQYMPDDGIGLPKNYGAHKPFKPTELGSNMRHFRKPNPKPIEI